MDAETFEDRLQRCIDEAMQPAVTAGAAVVTVSTQTSASESYRVIDVQPANAAASPVRLAVQSQEEVSLFVGPPKAPGSLTALPVVLAPRVGFATRTSDEPAVTGVALDGTTTIAATRTSWFSWRPERPGAVVVRADAARSDIADPLLAGALSVLDDDGTGTLRELPKQTDPYPDARQVPFVADPAHRYLIGIGCASALPCWQPTFLSVRTPGA